MDSSCNLRSIYLIIFINNLRLILLIGVGGSKVSVCEIKKSPNLMFIRLFGFGRAPWPMSRRSGRWSRRSDVFLYSTCLPPKVAPSHPSGSAGAVTGFGAAPAQRHAKWSAPKRGRSAGKLVLYWQIFSFRACKWNTTSETSLISDGQK
jgi:hypothetical protein